MIVLARTILSTGCGKDEGRGYICRYEIWVCGYDNASLTMKDPRCWAFEVRQVGLTGRMSGTLQVGLTMTARLLDE
jgi:hypothetical protein